LKFEGKLLIFIDEYGIQIFSRKSIGWAPKGVTPPKEVKQIRTRNYSVCAAMGSESLFFSNTRQTS
jgi:hypothetical protein